jgi:hypothetical protein
MMVDNMYIDQNGNEIDQPEKKTSAVITKDGNLYLKNKVYPLGGIIAGEMNTTVFNTFFGDTVFYPVQFDSGTTSNYLKIYSNYSNYEKSDIYSDANGDQYVGVVNGQDLRKSDYPGSIHLVTGNGWVSNETNPGFGKVLLISGATPFDEVYDPEKTRANAITRLIVERDRFNLSTYVPFDNTGAGIQGNHQYKQQVATIYNSGKVSDLTFEEYAETSINSGDNIIGNRNKTTLENLWGAYKSQVILDYNGLHLFSTEIDSYNYNRAKVGAYYETRGLDIGSGAAPAKKFIDLHAKYSGLRIATDSDNVILYSNSKDILTVKKAVASTNETIQVNNQGNTQTVRYDNRVEIIGGLKISDNGTELGSLYVTGTVRGSKVYNAVWNDIADMIEVPSGTVVDYGRVYCFDGEKYFSTEKRAQTNIIGIASDTYGYGLGVKDGKHQIPIGVAGFVLAYVDKAYEIGTELVSTKNGSLTKASFFEKIFKRNAIIATFWKDEKEENWNGISVKNRKWVKII